MEALMFSIKPPFLKGFDCTRLFLALTGALLVYICMLSPLKAENAEVYKYTDGDGKVHYDHKPPEGNQYETIKPDVLHHTSHNKTLENSTTAEPADAFSQKVYQSQLDGLEAERVKACNNAKENKRILLSTVRVSIKLPNGDEKLLSKEEKLEKLKVMDQSIKDYCSAQ